MLKSVALFASLAGAVGTLLAQTNPPPQNPGAPPAVGNPAVQVTQPQGGLKQRDDSAAAPGTYRVDPGTRILLSMINTVDTRHSRPGDRIYLETAFPIVSQGRIVIPQGSWVTGTVAAVKRGGHVKGHAEMQVRFDSLTLPNGVSRDFRADLGSADGRSGERVEGDHKPVAETIALTTLPGVGIGATVGAATGHIGEGIGIGAGIGAAAGLAGVLLSHGPDARLTKGTSVEMVLDRPVTFNADELDFSNVPPHSDVSNGSAPPAQQRGRLIRRIPY